MRHQIIVTSAARHRGAAPAGVIRHVGSGQTYATVQAALAAAGPADTVQVHAGTYARQTITAVKGSYITVMPFPGDTPIVAGFTISGGAYADITGFTTTAENRFTGAAHHAKFRNFIASCTNTTTNCFYVTNGLCHDLYIEDNVCSAPHQCGVQTNGGSASPTTWSYNVYVRGNTITGSNQDCMFIDGITELYIEDNILKDTQRNANHNDGIQVASCNGAYVRRNRIYMTLASPGAQYGSGIIIEHADGNTNANRLVQNVEVVGNLIYNWHGSGLIFDGVINAYCANNTVYDCWGEDSEPGGDGVAFSINGSGIYANQGTFEVWNNIFERAYRGSGSLPTFCSSNHYGDNTWDVLGTSTTTGNPLFADGDYHLDAPSAAIDSGVARSRTPTDDLFADPFGTIDRGAVAA